MQPKCQVPGYKEEKDTVAVFEEITIIKLD